MVMTIRLDVRQQLYECRFHCEVNLTQFIENYWSQIF